MYAGTIRDQILRHGYCPSCHLAWFFRFQFIMVSGAAAASLDQFVGFGDVLTFATWPQIVA